MFNSENSSYRIAFLLTLIKKVINWQQIMKTSNCLSIFVNCCIFYFQIGFRYGSLTEDLHTGFWLHCEGWTSVFCDPPQAAFLGDAPKTLHDALSQCKRWNVGQYEVMYLLGISLLRRVHAVTGFFGMQVGITRHSPLTFGVRKTSLGLGLTYSHLAFWGLWCIPITTYALLPQLALVNSRPLFPKVCYHLSL